MPLRSIEKEIIVDFANKKQVFNAWVRPESIKTFFAPDCRVELKILGDYEMYFLPDNEYGSKGSEGCRILSYKPGDMLSFTWNAPPQFPSVRSSDNTWVVLFFTNAGENKVQVNLSHFGWKEGEEWDKVYEYFDSAWEIVLNRLKDAFQGKTVDWQK